MIAEKKERLKLFLDKVKQYAKENNLSSIRGIGTGDFGDLYKKERKYDEIYKINEDCDKREKAVVAARPVSASWDSMY